MESHRIIIFLTLFAACALSVSGAAVQTPAAMPMMPSAEESKAALTETTAEQNTRAKKWAYLSDLEYAYSYHEPLTYAAYAPSYSYYPHSYYYPSMYSRYYYY